MKGLHPWEAILSNKLEVIQFLTGGYPLAAFFFPYLLQNPHFPVPVPSSARTLGSSWARLWLLLPSALSLAFPGQEREHW